MQNILMTFFISILRQDEITVTSIPKNDNLIYIDKRNDQLIFTINGLYELLKNKENISYSEFVKCLYSGTINEKLGNLGGKIEIHISHGKVNLNTYRLVRTEIGEA